MSGHDEGKLKVDEVHGHVGVRRVSDEAPFCELWAGSGSRPGNARRLVACWNAAIGLPTDMLEAVPFVLDAKGNYQLLQQEGADLLTALRNLRAGLSDFKGHGTPGFTDRALAYVLLQETDALLAKHAPTVTG